MAWLSLTAGGAALADDSGFLRQGDRLVVPEGPLRSRIAVAPVKLDRGSERLVLPAIVESDPARTASVLPPLSGRLVELKVMLGDRVARGQVLAVIDSPDLAQAYDDDEKAADALHLTEKNLKRQEEQLRIAAIAERDLDQARSDHAQAAAEYARTQARLHAIGAGPRGPDGRALLAVKAPVAGSVTTLSVAIDNMINDPTQPIMTVADLSEVWVTAMVAEVDIAKVFKDQDVEVTLAAYPGEVLKGKVLFASDVIEPDTRRDKVRIAFANPDHRLKPNMFATAALLTPPKQRVVLPASAILMNNDRITVFVETAPWTFERRTVQADLLDDGSAVIQSGLAGTERVVIGGGILLND